MLRRRERRRRERALQDYHAAQFKLQLAAGVPMAVGSDVGPFPHGTQARELVLMAQYGMAPVAVLQADYLNGAKLLGWDGKIGELKPGYFADVIAVPGNPLEDISVTQKVKFVMKDGVVYAALVFGLAIVPVKRSWPLRSSRIARKNGWSTTM